MAGDGGRGNSRNRERTLPHTPPRLRAVDPFQVGLERDLEDRRAIARGTIDAHDVYRARTVPILVKRGSNFLRRSSSSDIWDMSRICVTRGNWRSGIRQLARRNVYQRRLLIVPLPIVPQMLSFAPTYLPIARFDAEDRLIYDPRPHLDLLDQR